MVLGILHGKVITDQGTRNNSLKVAFQIMLNTISQNPSPLARLASAAGNCISAMSGSLHVSYSLCACGPNIRHIQKLWRAGEVSKHIQRKTMSPGGKTCFLFSSGLHIPISD